MKKSAKRFLKIAVLISLFLLSGISCFYQPPPVKIKKIKIFLETFATSPVIWESVELIKSPRDELKIFFFHRYPNQQRNLDLKAMNAIEIPLESKEGLWPYSGPAFTEHVKDILKAYPDNIPIEIYSNLNQAESFLMPFLFEADSKRIERLHLYEDGSCNILGVEYERWALFKADEKILRNIVETKGHPTIGTRNDWQAALSKLAPVTYHLCRADTIKKDPVLKPFVDYIGANNIATTDLLTEKKRLNGRERKQLARFFRIDLKKLKAKPFQKTMIITTAFYFGNKKAIQSEIDHLMPLTKLNNTRIFLKCHPSYGAKPECDEIKKAFPFWEEIDSSIPVEALFLTGAAPDYVGGYSSSLYFLIPSDKILFILGEQYMHRILQLGIIKPDRRKLPRFLN